MNSDNYLFIGDIAGQYDALLRLLKKCPDYLPISVGDMIDRGPDSKKVLEFFMKNGKALLGNHEHMMLDYRKYKTYSHGVWAEWNGGAKTLENFKDPASSSKFLDDVLIPEEITEWVSSLPLYMEIDGAFISHAPKNPYITLEQCCELVKASFNGGYRSQDPDCSIIWNRTDPDPLPNKFQIFGHNGYHYFITDEEKKDFAVCIDASRQGKLLAMVWPTKEIISENYI